MTFLHKLAKRIAGLPAYAAIVALMAVACTSGDKVGFLPPDPNKPVTPVLHDLRVEPQIAAAAANEEIQFTATGYSATGQVVPVVIDWYATGGVIMPDGKFTAGLSGHFAVTARVRTQPAIADSAQVSIWNNPTELVEVIVSPDSEFVDVGDTLVMTASVRLANGIIVPNATVQWTATAGSVDTNGHFASQIDGLHTVTASAVNGIFGNGHIFVRPRAKLLNRIRLNPPTASVLAGEAVVFSATADWSDGSSGAANVNWSATGGTISGSGLYTAGGTPGVHRVIAQDRFGSLADTAAITIQAPTISSLAVAPKTLTLLAGANHQFGATAQMSDNSWRTVPVSWRAAGGNVNGSGLYTAGPAAGSYWVVANANGSSAADSALVTVAQPVATLTQVIVNPSSVTLGVGAGRQFTITGVWSDGSTATPQVTWSASGGSISAGGFYTASAAGTYSVIAAAGNGVADTSVVVVTNPVLTGLSLTPATVSMTAGQPQQFAVTGTWSDGSTAAPSVGWSVAGGTMTAGGLFVAGSTPGTYAIVATHLGGTLADTSFVTIAPLPAVLTGLLLTPASSVTPPNSSVDFHVAGVWSNGSTTAPPVIYTATGGTISAGGHYNAGTVPGTYRVIAKHATGTLADTSSVIITSTLALTRLTIAPKPVTLSIGAGMAFTLSALWSDGTTTVPPVTWTATGGTVTGAGVYTAGATPGNYRVIAAHVGGTIRDTANITISVSPPTLTGIHIAPKPSTIQIGGTIQYIVTATWSDGSSSVPALLWASNGGAVSAGGQFTAGMTPGTYHVIVAHSGGTLRDTSMVTLTSAPPPVVTLTSLTVAPKPVSVQVGANRQFTASALWSDGSTIVPGLTWTATGGTISSGGLYTAGSTAGSYRVIAAHTAGTRKDTSIVTVTAAAPPTLTAVVVSPSPVSVQIGGSASFAAVGQYSDGSTASVAVNWSATGGSVSSGGLYSAGMSTGSYRVVAVQQGGTKADTASVTLTAAPPPPPQGPFYANQPSGMAAFSERSFNGFNEAGWTDYNDPVTPNLSIVQDPTAPQSGPNVGQIFFKAGFVGGSSPALSELMLPNGKRSVYVSFNIKFSSNWQANFASVNKIAYIWIANGARVYLNVGGSGSGPLQPQIRFQGLGTFNPSAPINDPTNVTWNGYPNLNQAAAVMTRGQWAHWEVVMVANTPGQYDGEAHVWLNGVKICQYTGVGYSGPAETGALNTWQYVMWNPIYGGGGIVPVDQTMSMDHIYVSVK